VEPGVRETPARQRMKKHHARQCRGRTVERLVQMNTRDRKW
jgi:hypothetical protein